MLQRYSDISCRSLFKTGSVMSYSKAILINDTSTKPHLGCRLVVSQIFKLAASHGIQMVATSSVHTDWRTQPALQDEMRKADIVIVNGEGTLHHSSRQAKALAEVGAVLPRRRGCERTDQFGLRGQRRFNSSRLRSIRPHLRQRVTEREERQAGRTGCGGRPGPDIVQSDNEFVPVILKGRIDGRNGQREQRTQHAAA